MATMTRQHFELIAEALAEARAEFQPTWNANLFRALDKAGHKLADKLATTNSNFDRDRFLEAAGVGMRGTA